MALLCAHRYRFIQLLILSGLSAFSVGCEEVIDSPFELVDSKLVITSTFAPRQPVKVRVTATQPVTGEVVLTDVRTATVSLFDGSQLLEELKHVPGSGTAPGYYTTQDFEPSVGHKYTVHALADGFTPVSAESRIPLHVEILSLEISDLSIMPMIDREVYDYQLTVDYADPTEDENFYDLRISQEVIPFRLSPLGDTLRYEPVLKSVLPVGGGFNMEPIIGGQASILLQDKPGESGVSVQLQSVIRPSGELLGSIHAELRTVSEPYYRFQVALQGEGAVSGGLIEPRVNSYTNVSSGYGVFAGYNYSTYIYNISL